MLLQTHSVCILKGRNIRGLCRPRQKQVIKSEGRASWWWPIKGNCNIVWHPGIWLSTLHRGSILAGRSSLDCWVPCRSISMYNGTVMFRMGMQIFVNEPTIRLRWCNKDPQDMKSSACSFQSQKESPGEETHNRLLSRSLLLQVFPNS